MVDSKPLFTGEEWDDIYGMPPNALKVWLFHYRCEIDGRESWPGEDLICYKLRICRDTLADNRKWLKDHGWLVQLTEAYPGHNPTFRVERGTLPLRGSKKKQANPFGGAPTVKSQSNHSENPADEPNASVNCRRDELPSQRKKADANNASVKSRRKNTDAKVSDSSSVSVSVSSSPSVEVGFTSFSTNLGTPSALAEKTKGTTDGEKAKPTPKPKTLRKTLAPDGGTWKGWDSHDQTWHTAKLIELGLTKPAAGTKAEEKTKTEDDFIPRCSHKDGKKRCFGNGEFGGLCLLHAGDL